MATIEALLESIDAKLGRLIELAERAERETVPRGRGRPPKVAAAPAATIEPLELPAALALTLLDVRAALVRANEARPPRGGLDVLRGFGVSSIVDLPPERFGEVIAAAESALAPRP